MALPETMKVVEITRVGPPEVLRVASRAVPAPGAGEVLIRVAAIGVCRPDSLQRQGMHPPPPGASDIPGLEVAGSVESVGAGVTAWRTGDAVCALLPGGGYAQFATAAQEQVLPIPANWTAAEAATLPENAFTAWENVFRRGRLAAGETILVHGGTSGLGSLTIMLARAFGARPLATAGTDAKCEACLRIGAEAAFNYKAGDWGPAVLETTGGRGVDMVLDIVGRDYVQRSLEVLATDGRIVHLATQGPDKLATIDMRTLIQKRGTILASALRWRPPAEKGVIARGLLEQVWPLLPARSPIYPLLDSVHPLADAAKVHEYFDNGAHVGKIVLIP
jgi:putative PIG3 family NAD(P)H quinone oxidoreductase